jgi:DNA-binding GntR family transcriptional regulator
MTEMDRQRGEEEAGEVSAEGGHQGLVNDLAQQIHAQIFAGALATGARLRQEDLAAQFGVSRTPIREALRMLHAAGAVVLIPNRGAIVRGPTAREIREAYAIRAELEGFAAETATARAGEAELRRLEEAERLFREAVARYVPAPSPAEAADFGWMEANDLFHDAILAAAGNDRLSRMIGELHKSFPRNLTWAALSEEPTLIEDNVNQHGRVLAAIVARDPEAARRWMTDHVRRAGELVASWYLRHRADADAEAAAPNPRRRSGGGTVVGEAR